MGRPGETEEERRIRKEKERKRRREKEKLKEAHSDDKEPRKKRDHESEKRDLKKRESSGDASRRKRDETEEERKIRKEKERREKKERESGSAKNRESRDRKENRDKDRDREKSRKREKSRRDETSAERKARKDKKRKEEKKTRSEGYLGDSLRNKLRKFRAPTKSKSMKESETKHTYDTKIDEDIDAEFENDPEIRQKPQIFEQDEIGEEYDDDFDDYEDDFEVFEPNKSKEEKENTMSTNKYSPDAVLDFDYSSLQRAMKREVSEASIKSQEAASEARRKKLSEINRPVSSSTPESEPIHSKKTIETYMNKSRKLYPNERRAREIQKLITFDSSHDISFNMHTESSYNRFLRNIGKSIKCVSVGTDDMQDSRSIQTEKIETSHSWTQNLLSNQSKEIKTRSEKFKLMPTEVLMNLVDVTEVLLEEIELERLENTPKEKRKITNDLEISENMKVDIDEDWKYITTLSHVTGGSKLFVANWLSGVTIYTPELMKIKTLSIYRDYIFLGMEYGAVIRQNLKDLKEKISSACINNSHSAAIQEIDVISTTDFISLDILGGLRKMTIQDGDITVIQKKELDEEIFAFTSSDHAIYLSLFDRITVLSRQNITNTIYNIVTHQPCSHLAIEPVNSLLVASNDIETLFYEIGRYFEKIRFDFAIRSVVSQNGSIYFISGSNQVIHFHVNEDRQELISSARMTPVEIFLGKDTLAIQTTETIEYLPLKIT